MGTALHALQSRWSQLLQDDMAGRAGGAEVRAARRQAGRVMAQLRQQEHTSNELFAVAQMVAGLDD